jgi:hypothetical protein
MDKKKCKNCDGVFEADSVIFEIAETEFVFTQSHCDDCIDRLEGKSYSCTRIKAEDLLEAINESL